MDDITYVGSFEFDDVFFTWPPFYIAFWVSELYDYCLKEKIADGNLIAKWKKQGYENLCCLRCIQTRDTNFGTNCICRVPKAKLEEVRICYNEASETRSSSCFYRYQYWSLFKHN